MSGHAYSAASGAAASSDKPGVLVLADGRRFHGRALGAPGEAVGEVVFCTAMTGYQEILTDPSYAEQIVVMSAPQIGNVGVTPEDAEAAQPHLRGFVVRERSSLASNWRARGSLGDLLIERGVVGLWDIDTRALVRHIRSSGAQMGILATTGQAEEVLWRQVREVPPMQGRDLASAVTCSTPHGWEEGSFRFGAAVEPPPTARHVVAYDFGIKRNLLRRLRDVGARVTVVPAGFPAAEAIAMSPDGFFLSNGPGDPAAVGYALPTVRRLIESGRPVFGVCLGHQLLGLALGGRTYKLKFGHRGANQPVKDLATGRVEITAQNHGFAVDLDSLRGRARLTHVNLNDGSVEGLALEDRPVFGVQYHPEASPGPHDSAYLFDRFAALMRSTPSGS